MKFESPSWIGVAGICASILVAIFNKWWGPVAAMLDTPLVFTAVWDRYPVIPQLKCYHDTISKILKYK
jgi:hypothetical protein